MSESKKPVEWNLNKVETGPVLSKTWRAEDGRMTTRFVAERVPLKDRRAQIALGLPCILPKPREAKGDIKGQAMLWEE